MPGKWWLLRAGGAGEPAGEAAEGSGAVGKVHLTRTRKNSWAEIGPLSSFSSCPCISHSGQGGRAAPWAALWPDPGRPLARPGPPFGPPFLSRYGTGTGICPSGMLRKLLSRYRCVLSR